MQDFPLGVVNLLGGPGHPKLALFGINVLEKERIVFS